MSDLRKAIEERIASGHIVVTLSELRGILDANPEPEPEWEWGLSYNRYTPALKDEKNARYLAEEDPEVFTLFKRTAPGPWVVVTNDE